MEVAVARIEATGLSEDAGAIRPAFYPSAMVGDVDRDGARDVAIPTVHYEGADTHRVHIIERPDAGVVTLADPIVTLTSSEDLDNDTGFGARILGGHDLDGDGWHDLLIGEHYWNADPEDPYRAYGRFMVFRGEVGR